MKYLMLVLLLWPLLAIAQEPVIELQGTAISGGQANPEITLELPWQAPPAGEQFKRDIQTDKERWLYTLDAARLEREISWSAYRFNPTSITSSQP